MQVIEHQIPFLRLQEFVLELSFYKFSISVPLSGAKSNCIAIISILSLLKLFHTSSTSFMALCNSFGSLYLTLFSALSFPFNTCTIHFIYNFLHFCSLLPVEEDPRLELLDLSCCSEASLMNVITVWGFISEEWWVENINF